MVAWTWLIFKRGYYLNFARNEPLATEGYFFVLSWLSAQITSLARLLPPLVTSRSNLPTRACPII